MANKNVIYCTSLSRSPVREEVIKHVMTQKDACVLWISPMNHKSRSAFNGMVKRVEPLDFKVNHLEMKISINNSKIYFKTSASHLRGIAPTLLVIEDATLIIPTSDYEIINHIIALMPDKE